MDRCPIKYRAPPHRAANHGSTKLAKSRDRAMMGHAAQDLPVLLNDDDVIGATKTSGTLGNRVQHRLQVGRRAADHAQDLTRSGLPLQGLLRLVEQSHVLDGNHGLVSEGLEELDLILWERPGLHAGDADYPDTYPITEHRNKEHAVEALLSLARDKTELS